MLLENSEARGTCVQTARMEELRAQAEAAEAEVRAAKKEVARHQAEGNAARRALAAHEAALEALATKRSDLLEAAQMEQVHPLPSSPSDQIACLYFIHRQVQEWLFLS